MEVHRGGASDRPSQQQKLEIEIEENVQRQDLSAEELTEGLMRLQKLRQPGLLARIWNFILRLLRGVFRRNRPPR